MATGEIDAISGGTSGATRRRLRAIAANCAAIFTLGIMRLRGVNAESCGASIAT
jgi:hypothetical protein